MWARWRASDLLRDTRWRAGWGCWVGGWERYGEGSLWRRGLHPTKDHGEDPCHQLWNWKHIQNISDKFFTPMQPRVFPFMCVSCFSQLISSKVPKAEYVPNIIRRDDPSIIPILYVSSSFISPIYSALWHCVEHLLSHSLRKRKVARWMNWDTKLLFLCVLTGQVVPLMKIKSN